MHKSRGYRKYLPKSGMCVANTKSACIAYAYARSIIAQNAKPFRRIPVRSVRRANINSFGRRNVFASFTLSHRICNYTLLCAVCQNLNLNPSVSQQMHAFLREKNGTKNSPMTCAPRILLTERRQYLFCRSIINYGIVGVYRWLVCVCVCARACTLQNPLISMPFASQ